MKQTAVEFLQECLSIHLSHQQQMQFEGLFQQAKEMEKEQIMDAYMEGGDWEALPQPRFDNYYNQTFNTRE
jgi:hypothetical protein